MGNSSFPGTSPLSLCMVSVVAAFPDWSALLEDSGFFGGVFVTFVRPSSFGSGVKNTTLKCSKR